jgi:hypothetical protein
MGYLGKQITITGTQNSKRLSVLATDGQTTFTVSNGYTVGQLDVYRNGVKLSRSRDFTASDGTSVVLISAASANDIVEFVVFENFDVANAITTGGDQTISGALTVEGDFTAGTALTVTNGGVTAGILTAQSFHGDGSGLTGVGATDDVSTSSLVVAGISTLQNVTAGVATANQFSGNISGTAATFTTFNGNATGLTGTPDLTIRNITGVAATFTGVLTYDDVTNIDSLGLVTARNGLQVLAGITTLNGQVSAGNLSVTGIVTAASFSGDGSNLSNVISGFDIESGGTFLGAGVTSVNFQSGATVTSSGAGATITIASGGISTTAGFSTNTNRSLDLDSAQDHKYNVTGFVTFTCSGGTEGESHTLRVINSGIATVGFSTFFLFPSGASPSLPTTDGAISLISFTVNRVGTGGTQLLAGASVNFS